MKIPCKMLIRFKEDISKNASPQNCFWKIQRLKFSSRPSTELTSIKYISFSSFSNLSIFLEYPSNFYQSENSTFNLCFLKKNWPFFIFQIALCILLPRMIILMLIELFIKRLYIITFWPLVYLDNIDVNLEINKIS